MMMVMNSTNIKLTVFLLNACENKSIYGNNFFPVFLFRESSKRLDRI